MGLSIRLDKIIDRIEILKQKEVLLSKSIEALKYISKCNTIESAKRLAIEVLREIENE